jgi:AcrR family transcriptional regulator
VSSGTATSAPPADGAASTAAAAGDVGAWADGTVGDAADRPLIHAAVRCVARWGIRKTSLDDIAREAGVSRATAYRVFPGGKDRVVEVLFQHRAGCLFQEWSAELQAAPTLEDLLVVGVGAALRLPLDDEVTRVVLAHEPELVLPHLAFDRLDRVFDVADALCRPHLRRFLPDDEVRAASELLARTVLTFAFRPAPWIDPHDPTAVRRLVRTYLLPALAPVAPPPQENP